MPAPIKYHIPDTAWIMSRPWNGLKVVSTFSGCGGSCLGYRWAGCKVVWANEFLPAAQDSYRANFRDTFLDCHDIREVKAMQILMRTGLRQGELDLFDGSPPCQAFSMAGKREKGWGKEKTYEHGAKQCNEKMFDEYNFGHKNSCRQQCLSDNPAKQVFSLQVSFNSMFF